MAPVLNELISRENHQYQVESNGSEDTNMPNAKGNRKERLEGRKIAQPWREEAVSQF